MGLGIKAAANRLLSRVSYSYSERVGRKLSISIAAVEREYRGKGKNEVADELRHFNELAGMSCLNKLAAFGITSRKDVARIAEIIENFSHFVGSGYELPDSCFSVYPTIEYKYTPLEKGGMNRNRVEMKHSLLIKKDFSPVWVSGPVWVSEIWHKWVG